MLKPVLDVAKEKLVDSETGKEYDIGDDGIATLEIGKDVFKVNTRDRENRAVPGFETGSYDVVQKNYKKDSKPAKEEKPSKPKKEE